MIVDVVKRIPIYVIVEYVFIINVIVVFVGNDIHVTIDAYSIVCDLLWWWWNC
jgi:hypothetical protein